MGQFCWMCERMRPNESFSGRNHGRHLCRECARLPKSERDRKSRLSALTQMLTRQSNISKLNIRMASAWSEEGDPHVIALAQVVAEIGRVHPHKKHRLSYIRKNKPELWRRMTETGVVDDWPNKIHQHEFWDDQPPLR